MLKRISNKFLIRNNRFIGILFTLIMGLILLISIPLHGQYKNMQFESFNETNGLSNNNVNCILKDAEGFIWVGTDNGLNRFDGYNFTSYVNNSDDSTSLIHNHVLTLFLASDSTLWVGTQYGMCRFQKEYNNFVQIHERYIDGFTRGFFEDQNGQVYAVLDRGEIFSLKDNRLTSKHNANIYAHCYLKGNDDIHWFGVEDGICKYYASKDSLVNFSLRRYNSGEKVAVFALQEYNNKLWIGTRGFGVFLFDLSSNQITHLDESLDFIKTIEKDNHGLIFIGNTIGLKVYNQDYKMLGSYKPFKKYNQQEIDNSVEAIYSDKQGNLWLGVKFRGIQMAYPQKGFHSLKEALVAKVSQEVTVASVLADDDQNIWLGSFNNGILKLNLRSGKSEYIPCAEGGSSGLQCGTVFELFRDKNLNIWIGSYFGGLQKLIPETKQVIHYSLNHIDKNEQSLKDIRSICEDYEGNYWIAPQGNGLIKWNMNTGEYEQFLNNYNDSSSLCSNWVFHVICDSMGYIWCATSSGLSVTRNNGKTFENYYHKSNNSSKLLSNEVFTVFEDSNNQIWVGTRKGISKYRKESNDFIHYTSKDGLINDFICAIQEDHNGLLWISTMEGLSCFNPKTIEFKNYDMSDDFPSNEFMENSCAITPSGYLIFGGINGGIWFHPDSITENKFPPKVKLTDFKIFNQSVPIKPNDKNAVLNKDIQYTRNLTIDHKQKMISFDFVALSFVHPEQNKYAYKLENFDNDWINANDKREATYTSLPPGKYIFRVKAANNDGYWNNEGASVQITVLPSPWKTWWFRLIVIILFLSITFLIYYLRVQRMRAINLTLEDLVDQRTKELQTMNMKLQELNATKDKLFSIIGHDLMNPINTINGFSELYINSYQKLSDEKKWSYMSHIHTEVNKTIDLLDGLLNWARSKSGTLAFNPKKINLHNLIEVNITFNKQAADKKKIRIQSEIDEEYIIALGDENMINTVLRNLISNAIKFTPNKGSISIKCGPFSESGFVLLEVSDTGVGILSKDIDCLFRIDSNKTTKGTEGETGTGLGLILCKEFVEKNNGTIWIESEVEKGSSFFFTLPVVAPN